MLENDESSKEVVFPTGPIDRFIKPLTSFLHVEAASGVVLFVCSLIAMGLANSPIAESYLAFWKTEVGFTLGEIQLVHSLKHWINDALMAIFFFVIGLEVKREIALGELRELRRAAFPIAAAIGGMVIPAGIYLAMQHDQPGQSGWGVPMATDIAFVVGCMALLGRRIPAGLRVVLLSLAIADDIGAIIVIAVGYTDTLNLGWLGIGVAGIGLVSVMQRLGVRAILVYTLAGAVIWFGFHESGIHATIAGVILGMMTPAHPYLERGLAGKLLRGASKMVHGGAWESEPHRAEKVRTYLSYTRETISPLEYLIYTLHPWVAFVIMPIFALANAGVPVQGSDVVSPIAIAVILGLAVGKPVGIVLISWLSVQLRLTQLPAGVTWRHMLGGGCLAGIGFTMALFISGLAFSDDDLLRPAKVGVLIASVLSAIVGMTLLGTTPISVENEEVKEEE